MIRHRPAATFWAALLALLTALVLVGPRAGVPHAAAASQATTLADLPLPAQAAISAALGRDQASYHVRRAGDGYGAENPKHGLAVRWTPSGMEVGTGTDKLGLALTGCGYGDVLVAAGAVSPRADGNRVE